MSNDEYDYGYLKHSILEFCINEILEKSRLNDHLQDVDFSKDFNVSNLPAQINGKKGVFILNTPRGNKKFRITVDGPLGEKGKAFRTTPNNKIITE